MQHAGGLFFFYPVCPGHNVAPPRPPATKRNRIHTRPSPSRLLRSWGRKATIAGRESPCSGGATRPPRRDQLRRPTSHRSTLWDHTSTPLEPRQERFRIYWLPGLPSSVFVCVVIDRAIGSCVRPYVCVFVFARVLVLSNCFLIALPQLLDTTFCQPDSAK